ncbi:MAG: pyruvate kinase, partial [Pelagibacterales bacterium]|nr:pyruvate kinase [Pelagibacterales bacterium]
MRKRTKIITTLGPASSSPKIIKNLITAGTDVFRINLSHSTIGEIENIIDTLKKASAQLKRPVATLIDLQGQKIRIKGFANKKFIKLNPNSEFILDATLDDNKGSQKSVGITYKDLSKNVEVG